METPSSSDRTGYEASRPRILLAIPAQPRDAGAGVRPNDGARLGRPVLDAVKPLLDPLGKDVSALGVVGVHRAGVDARARWDALLDELLEPLDATLTSADLVDEDAITVLHLDDRLDGKERAEGGLGSGHPASTAEVL